MLGLLLASASPRRRDLLRDAGYDFAIRPADIDETFHRHETPLLATSRIAWEKAERVLESAPPDHVILAADTTVVVAGRPFGKPDSAEHAAEMLRALSGRNHTVMTCWALAASGGAATPPTGGVSLSIVRMRELGEAEIRAYIDTEEPYDKAGAYAVQGDARRFVAAVLGSLDNVIGLPVEQVARALRGFGVFPRSS